MKYAVGVSVIMAGALLIYAGFNDVRLWDTFLGVIRNEPAS